MSPRFIPCKAIFNLTSLCDWCRNSIPAVFTQNYKFEQEKVKKICAGNFAKNNKKFLDKAIISNRLFLARNYFKIITELANFEFYV